MSPTVPLITGLRHIAHDYRGILIDLWGVVHNGVHLFPHVLTCLQHLREHDIRVIFLSNAPRRASGIRDQLKQFGIATELYVDVISSGEDAWHALHQKSRQKGPYKTWGNRFYHIGPLRDTNVYEDLSIEKVNNVEHADFILNSGPWRDTAHIQDYQELLQRGFQCGCPMICLNPDLEVIRGTRRVICAGSLAHYYENLGGQVTYHGKPYESVYRRCCERLQLQTHHILCLGDSLRTDIAGAHRFGIDSILVLTGLLDETALETASIRPMAFMRELIW